MVTQYTCPRCHQIVADERRFQTPCVCDCCGFVLSPSETRQAIGDEKSMIVSACIFGVVILGFIYHLGSWGGYSLEIIPLKAAHSLHMSSAKDMERIAEIGMDIRNYELVEEMYRDLSERVDKKNYVRLAKFQFSRADFGKAVNTYRLFFQATKDNSLEARYDYARALAEAGQIDEAAKNFDYVLQSKPGIRQVTVIQKYVTMLVRAQRYDQAKAVIDRARRNDPTASTFMDTEYKVITERRKGHT